VESFPAAHPEHAGQLREVLPALEVLAGLCGSAGSGQRPDDGEPGEAASGCLGDFRIVREIGRGGMGVVYEAEQVSLRRRVALKVLPFAATMDSRDLQRFHNEARAAAALDHPNIVPVYSVGCERGVHFFAMKLIDGRSLAAVLGELHGEAGPAPASAETVGLAGLSTQGLRRGKEYFRSVARLGMQVAEALDYAHERGVIHRDVKPANILVDGNGVPWVTDFGLAHLEHAEASLTVTGDLVGTLRYMSPEQAAGQRVGVDHRTDVYSLGATLYELLTLRPAFEGKDRPELLRQVAFEEPAIPRKLDRGIPAELETIVLKALEKNPADRYATAKEMAADLRRWLEDRPIRARRPSLFQRAVKWYRRHQALVAAAAVALFVIAVALAVTLFAVLASNQRREQANGKLGVALEEEKRALRREQQATYRLTLPLTDQALRAGDVAEARHYLGASLPALRGWEWHHLHRQVEKQRELLDPNGPRPLAHAFTTDGKYLASVRVWQGERLGTGDGAETPGVRVCDKGCPSPSLPAVPLPCQRGGGLQPRRAPPRSVQPRRAERDGLGRAGGAPPLLGPGTRHGAPPRLAPGPPRRPDRCRETTDRRLRGPRGEGVGHGER
jgi:tRNA A-37 threonylcarbamoyl transferase component Bud32